MKVLGEVSVERSQRGTRGEEVTEWRPAKCINKVQVIVKMRILFSMRCVLVLKFGANQPLSFMEIDVISELYMTDYTKHTVLESHPGSNAYVHACSCAERFCV